MSDDLNNYPYVQAGVKSQMVSEGVARLRRVLSRTFEFNDRARPITDLSFFAALIDIGRPEYLAVCTDGVGTKLLIAQMMDKYDTIGIDCVAMNVNDVICVGAAPITIVDYLAVQEPGPDFLEAIAKGLYKGAKLSRASISGGEVAQVREIIKGENGKWGFDLAATCIGLVNRDEVIVGRDAAPGDAILALLSSGLHSNGYSLVRRIVFDKMNFGVDTYDDELGKTIGEELLTPTHIYVPEVLEVLKERWPSESQPNRRLKRGLRDRRPARAPADIHTAARMGPDRRRGDVPSLQYGHWILSHRPRRSRRDPSD